MRTPFRNATEVHGFRWRELLCVGLLFFGTLFPYQASAQDILCPDMRVTHNVFGPEVADLSSAVRADAGPNASPAEWSEVKACYEKFGLGYFHKLGIGKVDPKNPAIRGNRALVLVNRVRYHQAPSSCLFRCIP